MYKEFLISSKKKLNRCKKKQTNTVKKQLAEKTETARTHERMLRFNSIKEIAIEKM